MENIATILTLKNAQYGLELYSTLFGVVYLKGVNDDLTIAVYDKNKIARYFNKYGQYFDGFDEAECQLFPAKGMSWGEWELPVNHRFKIGDIIISKEKDRFYQITDIRGKKYFYDNSCRFDYIDIADKCYELWSAQDAKPGDVLVDNVEGFTNPIIFILKKFEHVNYGLTKPSDYSSYCFLTASDKPRFKEGKFHHMHDIKPATQEQKDLLFSKMDDAGYKWDPLYKELTRKTKFKVGDWITDGSCKGKITAISNEYYLYSKNGIIGEIGSIDKKYHIWTIDDAKPGDILCYKDEISIYKNSLMDFLDKFTGFQYYCCYDGKVLVTNGFYSLTEKDKSDVKPATEEQIVTLFSYMTPAGYIWDFSNKALKETKFKIGNWVVSNIDKSIGQITKIIWDKQDSNTLYDYEHTNGFFTNDFEDNYHLWTIKDAKDGHILSAKIDGDDYILLFKQIKDGWIETYGHYYNKIDKFCVPTQMFCRDYQGTLHPATKKQRKTFFKKMHNAGYDWDPNKKELYKIIKPKFNVGDVVIYKEIARTIKKIDKDYYEFEGCAGSCPIEKQDELLLISPAPKFKVGDEIETGNTIETIAEVGYTIRSYYCESGRTIYFANQDLWHLVSKPHYDISNFHVGIPVLVRADNNCKWDYSVFSRITGNEDWKFAVCNGVSFTQCIPFNEKTKYLLGTTDMCPEEYINW